jgi:hypothetical protein
MYFQSPDQHTYIDDLIRVIRMRLRGGHGMKEIGRDLGRFIPQEQLYLYYVAAAIMERDYGRRDKLLK